MTGVQTCALPILAGGEAGQVLGHQTLIRLIREAGLEPVQRDTLYSSLKVC